MRTKYLFVLIHITSKCEFSTTKHCSNRPVFLLTVPRWCFFFGSFVVICGSGLSAIVPCIFLAALSSSVGKGLISWHSCM